MEGRTRRREGTILETPGDGKEEQGSPWDWQGRVHGAVRSLRLGGGLPEEVQALTSPESRLKTWDGKVIRPWGWGL